MKRKKGVLIKNGPVPVGPVPLNPAEVEENILRSLHPAEENASLPNSGGPAGEQVLLRASRETPLLHLEYPGNIRLLAFLKRPQACFVGFLYIPPQKTLAKENTPQADLVFCSVLEGDLLVTTQSKEYFFRTGENFSLSGSPEYELYNPHQFKELTLVLVAFPSFI